MVPNYNLLLSFILFNDRLKLVTLMTKQFLTCAQFFAVELSSLLYSDCIFSILFCQLELELKKLKFKELELAIFL